MQNDIKKISYFKCFSLIMGLLLLLLGCAPPVTHQPETAMQAVSPTEQQPMPTQPAQQVKSDLKAIAAETSQSEHLEQPLHDEGVSGLPVRYQQSGYFLSGMQDNGTQPGIADEEFTVLVGADISSTTGPVALRDIIKRLAALKNMNISWASDVDQHAFVDVDIRAEDDFFKAIDNLLRQVEYFHEVQGNTIIVKYKETRKFHIAMPFIASSYEQGVGGDVLGGNKKVDDDNVKGNIKLYSTENTFDVWENIKTNLDQVLEIWTEEIPQKPSPTAPGQAPPTGGQIQQAAQPQTKKIKMPGKGFYTIDKPIGLITVTAPRLLLEKVESYLDNLKKELYKQIAIEAKIIEVLFERDDRVGIDWSGLLRDFNLSFSPTYGNVSATNPLGDNRSLVLSSSSFNLVVDALATQGKTTVLANPKVSVMNGQPSLISVGESITYIDSVESKIDEGVISYTVNTSSVMSGLGLSVIATIMENNEIVLTLTPVTSQLDEEIEYRDFGGVSGATVGLPKVKIREMSTTVRIKDGDMLVIGGLIDNTEIKEGSKVPILGSLPLINKLFSSEKTVEAKKELIILLRPKIIS